MSVTASARSRLEAQGGTGNGDRALPDIQVTSLKAAKVLRAGNHRPPIESGGGA